MPEKKERAINYAIRRTIDTVAVNEIRAAHGRLLRCIESSIQRDGRSTDDLDQAEFLIRCALARTEIKVRGRKIQGHGRTEDYDGSLT